MSESAENGRIVRLERIEFMDGRYVPAIWAVFGKKKDFLAAVWRDPGRPWRLVYRFRYYVDRKTHGSEDERCWYEAEIDACEPEARLLAFMNRIAEMASREYNAPIHKLVLRTDNVERILEALQRENFMHVGAPFIR